MSIRLIFPALLVAATGATAMGQTSPGQAAKAFTLDSIAPNPTATPTASPSPTPSPGATPDAVPPAAPTLTTPAVPESAAVASPMTPPAIRAVFTLDTPIQALIADPGAKAVLDKDLPGMSDDQNLDKFKMLSLHALQPQTGGQLTDGLLAKVAADLDLLGGTTEPVAIAPVKAGNSKRNADTSR